MGLIFCMECRREVSDKGSKCPYCGAPFAAGSASWGPAAPASRKRGGTVRVVKFVLLVAVLGGAYWVWQAATSVKKAPFSAGLAAAFRDARKIADERLALKPGQHVSYAFGLDTDSRVHVRIVAVSDPVDTMLMSKPDADRFLHAAGDLFAGGYSGQPAFSSKQVGMLDKTEIVPKGEWVLVVVRPRDGGSGAPGSSTEVALTVY